MSNEKGYHPKGHRPGQVIATSHEFSPPKGIAFWKGKGIPVFPGNLGW